MPRYVALALSVVLFWHLSSPAYADDWKGYPTPIVIGTATATDQLRVYGFNLRGANPNRVREVAVDIYRENGALLHSYTMHDIVSVVTDTVLVLRLGTVPPHFHGSVQVRNAYGASNLLLIETGDPACPANGTLMGDYADMTGYDWVQLNPTVFRYDPPHSDQPAVPVFVPFFGRLIGIDGKVGTPGEYLPVRSALFECNPK